MSSVVEQIKTRLTITDVVGGYLKLDKAGINLKACCPFHNEKTPSFFVSPARDSWHCFGCNRGGDLISFVQEIEGLDFLGALKLLADRTGVKLEPLSRQRTDERERLYAALEAATAFYQKHLAVTPAVKDYLRQRGVTDETVAKFRLGFAPPSWRAAGDELRRQGFAEADLTAAGLVVSRDGSTAREGSRYDRFRGRIMFPINDSVGRVVGFSGRVLGRADAAAAKYVNSPQTPLYDKSNLLYGYDRARQAIRRAGHCVLVEGQMDLILAHQAGTENVVAVSGTALTANQLQLIKRLADSLILAFDADLAGQSAASRSIDGALAVGLDVRIAPLPTGLDPADLILADPKRWMKELADALPVIDYCLAAARAKAGDDKRRLAQEVSRRVLPYIAKLPNQLEQGQYAARASDLLGVKEELIWAELKKLVLSDAAPTTDALATEISKPSRRQRLEERLAGLLVWLRTDKQVELADRLSQELATLVAEQTVEDWLKRLTTSQPALLLQAELTYAGMTELAAELTDLIKQFRETVLKDELTGVLEQIKDAEAKADQTALDNYLKKCQDISKSLNELKEK